MLLLGSGSSDWAVPVTAGIPPLYIGRKHSTLQFLIGSFFHLSYIRVVVWGFKSQVTGTALNSTTERLVGEI